jgi:predicted RNA binding protein YcfA (HicA-like mRNA interferase family)
MELFVPRKIRDLIADLEAAGFVNRGGKGSHRNFVHPNVAIPISLLARQVTTPRNIKNVR